MAQDKEKKREYGLEYRAKNKEKKREYDREYRAKNKDKIRRRKREDARRWYAKDPEKFRVRSREYAEKNRDKVREKNKKWRGEKKQHIKNYWRRYYLQNQERLINRRRKYYSEYPEKVREASKKWKRANPAKVREHHRRYHRLNPDAARVASARRRARIRLAPGAFTASQFRALCARYDWQCLRCGQRKPLTADHVIPLARGGSNRITNIQPLCETCNKSKNATIADYRTHPAEAVEQLRLWD